MEINNRYFYFSIKKAEECLFSRRNGYQGILLFGYSFFFRIKRKFDLEKAEKKFHVDVIEPLSKKIQEEIDKEIVKELINMAQQPITPNESLEDFKMAVNKLSYVVNSVGINNSFDRTMARNCVDEVTIAFNTYIKTLINEKQ